MRKVALFCILFFSFLNFSNASTSSAHEYVLMDMKSGRVLKGKNYNSPVLIASITKIMSCLLAVESKKLDETVMVSDTCSNARRNESGGEASLFNHLINNNYLPKLHSKFDEIVG